MKLLQVAKDKYVVVQDDCFRAVELVILSDEDGVEVITEGTNKQISQGHWYGWKQLTPEEIKTYMECKVVREGTKLKQIIRYCKAVEEQK